MRHCFTRSHRKKNLLQENMVKNTLMKQSGWMCQEKYEFELVATEIVSNHIPLVIKKLADKETISCIMQFIKARIAEKYNRAMGITGAFWNE